MKHINEKFVYEGQWLSVQETIYETKQGIQITWESIVRKRSTVGVIILAKMVPSGRIILIEQFRPAAHGYVLGLPAGLAFDDPAHALVELKEETGYTGKIVQVSPVLKTGSTITNENGRIVCIEVDEKAPENNNPPQHLEPGEDIRVHLVDPKNALTFLEQKKKEDVHIASNLWYLFGLKNWI